MPEGPFGMPRLTSVGPLTTAKNSVAYDDAGLVDSRFARLDQITGEWFANHAVFKKRIIEQGNDPVVTIPINERTTVGLDPGTPVRAVATRRGNELSNTITTSVAEDGRLFLSPEFRGMEGEIMQFVVTPRNIADAGKPAARRFGLQNMTKTAIFKAPPSETQGAAQVNIPKDEVDFFGRQKFPDGVQTAVGFFKMYGDISEESLLETPRYSPDTGQGGITITSSGSGTNEGRVLNITTRIVEQRGLRVATNLKKQDRMVQWVVFPPVEV